MKTLLQVNTVGNCGSTGKIVESIGVAAQNLGWNVISAFGRKERISRLKKAKLACNAEIFANVAWTRFFDSDSPFSKLATRRLISLIKAEKPDIIHLHNLHGYYLNCHDLFEFLLKIDTQIVWTLHDCWSFTGHCAHFDDCKKWQTLCHNCPKKHDYPKSLLFDNSKNNFLCKKRFAQKAKNLTMVPVSHWLDNLLKKSIFSNRESVVIHNGINTKIFAPQTDFKDIKDKFSLPDKKIVLGVANVWSQSKGYNDFIKLTQRLNDAQIVLVGVNKSQKSELAKHNIIGIERTENQAELAKLYSLADVFANPTYLEALGMVNREAISCATPVVSYNTGGCPESINAKTGIIVEKGNIKALANAISEMLKNGKSQYAEACRKKALAEFDEKDRFLDYIKLYETLLGK